MHYSSHKTHVVFTDDTSFFISTLDVSIPEVINVDDYVRILGNSTGVSNDKGMASDNGSIVGGVSNSVVIDKEKCVDDDECAVKVKGADESELIGRVSSIDATFTAYNDYAFCRGSSSRCDKLQRREGSQEIL